MASCWTTAAEFVVGRSTDDILCRLRSALDSWYSLSFLLVSLLATVVTVLIGIGTSLLPGENLSAAR